KRKLKALDEFTQLTPFIAAVIATVVSALVVREGIGVGLAKTPKHVETGSATQFPATQIIDVEHVSGS
ncbi:hypothetical protein ACSTI4_24280, partial [Vibrio parahaemolyticus]